MAEEEAEGTTGAAASTRASDRGDSSSSLGGRRQHLNPVQRQRVDRAFERLFGFSWREEDDGADGDDDATTATLQVLSDLLGRRAAVRLLRSHRHLAQAKWRVAVRRRAGDSKDDDTAISLPPPPARSRTAASRSAASSSSPGKTSHDQRRSESGNDKTNGPQLRKPPPRTSRAAASTTYCSN